MIKLERDFLLKNKGTIYLLTPTENSAYLFNNEQLQFNCSFYCIHLYVIHHTLTNNI